MNTRTKMQRFSILTLTVVAAIFMVSLSSCGNSSAESADEETKKPEDLVSVSVQKIQPTDYTETLKLSGTIESYEDVQVAAEEGGKLVKWVASKGAYVSKGSVIARLDSSVLKPAYNAAYAQYRLAEVTYQKQKKVYDEQAISELQLKTLEYQRDAAKAQSDLAKARFEKTVIRSPLNGRLNNRYFEEGELVGPGMPLAHVVSTGHLKVSAGVPERYAGRLVSGDEVTFTVDAFPGETYTGKITFIAASVHPDNRTIPVEISIKNPSGKLKPSMITSVYIKLKSVPDAVVIPSDYIQQVDINKFVVYVENNGKAVEREITVGSSSQGKAYITKGLKTGDKLITRGFQNVAQNQKVEVK